MEKNNLVGTVSSGSGSAVSLKQCCMTCVAHTNGFRGRGQRHRAVAACVTEDLAAVPAMMLQNTKEICKISISEQRHKSTDSYVCKGTEPMAILRVSTVARSISRHRVLQLLNFCIFPNTARPKLTATNHQCP